MKETNCVSAFILPFNKEQLDSMMDVFSTSNIVINYKESLKNLKCNSSFLNYLANCDINTVLMQNYELDDDLEDLLLEYVKFDRLYDINCLDDIWLNILNTKTLGRIEPNFEKFIKEFRNKHKDIVEEMTDFFYSIHRVLMYIICDGKNEDLTKELNEAKSAKMTRFNVNVISLMNSGILFYPWICNLYRETPLRKYEEFSKPVINGNTIISNILMQYKAMNPYKSALMRNQFGNPKYREYFINQIKEKIETAKEAGVDLEEFFTNIKKLNDSIKDTDISGEKKEEK